MFDFQPSRQCKQLPQLKKKKKRKAELGFKKQQSELAGSHRHDAGTPPVLPGGLGQ